MVERDRGSACSLVAAQSAVTARPRIASPGRDPPSTPNPARRRSPVPTFRYYLSTGGFKETSFDLPGAKAAIAEAVGVKAEADPVVAKAEIDRKAVFETANANCKAQFPPTGNTFKKHLECLLAASRQFSAK